MKRKVAEAFGGIVEYYDEYMGETGHVQAQRKISKKISVEGKILDVATGTGVMIEGSVDGVGIDTSREMLLEAKRKNDGSEFIVADVEYIPFKDKAFTVAVSCLSFLWIPDQKSALEEMVRVSHKTYIVEEEGVPARKRVNIPKHLEAFFEEIERFEGKIDLNLDSIGKRMCEADIDGSHKFICWSVQ